MARKPDTKNIAQTLGEVDSKYRGAKTAKDGDIVVMQSVEKLYNLLQPNFTTVQPSGIIFYNSSEDYNDNAYPNQLIDYYNNASSTFSKLITLRRNMLIGNGLQPVIQNDAQTIEFLNRENEFGMTMQDNWEAMCFDTALFESYFLETIYNQAGRVAEIVHQDTSTVRAVANESNNLRYVKEWQLSRSWGRTNKGGKVTQPATKGIPIKNWKPQTWAEDGGRQLLSFRQYTSGNEAYAIPSFNSILPYVELDAQLAQYNLTNTTKGFTPTSIVVLNGKPSKQEQDEFVNKFKRKYTGANGEKVLFIWTTGEGEKPEIIPFNTVDNTPMIELLDKILTQKIASGIGANAELAGVQSQGSSLQSDMNKLAVSYNFFYKTSILPLQKQMLQTLNKIMRHNGLSDLTVVTPPLELDTPRAQTAPVPQNNNINQ